MFAAQQFSQVNKGQAAAAGGAATITFAGHAENTADVSNGSRTFTAAQIGTAAANRHVIVCLASGSSSIGEDWTVVTVAGQSCSKVVSVGNGNNGHTAIWITDSPVTSGTTADIVVTNTGNFRNTGCVTYAATNLVSTTATATDTETADNTAMAAAISAGGIGVAISTDGATNGNTCTTTGVTVDVNDILIETSRGDMEAGSTTSVGAGTMTVTFDWSATNLPAQCCATFR